MALAQGTFRVRSNSAWSQKSFTPDALGDSMPPTNSRKRHSILENSPLERNGNYLPIGETQPEIGAGQATYPGLSVVIPFPGKIPLAKDFIPELYIHMGYQKPMAFKTVLDITLQDGQVVEIRNRSQEMEEKPGAFKSRYEPGISSR